MRKKILACGIASLAVLAGCVKEHATDSLLTDNGPLQSQAARTSPVNEEDEYVPGEVLIKFKAGTQLTGRANALSRIGGRLKEHIHTNAMKHYGDAEGIHLVSIQGQGVLQAIERLQSAPEVEYAEPNYIYRHGDPKIQDLPIEASYTDGRTMWGMYSNDSPEAIGPAGTTNQYGTWAEKAWNKGHTGSNDVYVGIIDEGIKYEHPDLDANIWSNPYDLVDGQDNDRNGYIDDTHGWDFAQGNNTIYDNDDDHGTHVAGTIGAKANNEVTGHFQGVVGVNWQVTMISGKFLGPNGGTTAGAIKAVDYFTDLKIRHKLNIVATNNSWGGGGFSQALLDAITRGAKQNILFIAAAGNGNLIGIGQNNDKKASYPSSYSTLGQTGGPASNLTLNDGTATLYNDGKPCGYDAVIAVAAIDKYGRLAGFSNHGAKTVDLGAPGVDIWSTVGNSLNYEGYNGTSMATPHVTGAAALYASTRLGVTAVQIKEAILNAAKATRTSSLVNKTVTGGRLNVGEF